MLLCRALMGTWIEIGKHEKRSYRTVSRALMGTWIEIQRPATEHGSTLVVPSWARGLKSNTPQGFAISIGSCPHGHVD